jgi:hypothetical protein
MARTLRLLATSALLFALPGWAQDNCILSTVDGEDDSPKLAQALSDCSLVEVPEGVTLNISTMLDTSTLSDTTLVSPFLRVMIVSSH